ncbi:MAG: DNA primase [Oscillospiraceae bacterium]
MALPQGFLQELHDRNDIVEVIGSYDSLKRRGRLNTGLCPFHNEKTPSFVVYSDTQSYFCFGCGAGGDVITFIKTKENLDYIESVRLLANRAGMTMPEDMDDSGYIKRKRAFDINKLAARYFFATLNSDAGKNARGYLRARKLSDSSIKRFGIGYAGSEWSGLRDHLHTQGYKDDELVEAGVCTKSEKGTVYDFFRERIMFPIFDLRGNVIAFSGRTVTEDNRKYLNTRDTIIFKKSRAIFAMNIAKNTDTRRIILCEGQMDVIAMHQAGFENAVAACGTALTDEQVRMISQYADEVVLAYDDDGAGQKAARRAIDMFKNTNILVKVLKIDGAKDPDEYIKKNGADRFRELVDKSSNSVEYELRRARLKYDIETDNGRVQYLKDASEILARTTSPTERDLFAGRVSQDIGVSKEAILLQSDRIRKRVFAKQNREQSDKLVRGVGEKFNIRGIGGTRLASASAQRQLISLLYMNPDLSSAVSGQISKSDFVSGDEGVIFEELCRLMERDEFNGMASVSEALQTNQISILSGILAENNGINYSAEDANFLIDKIVKNREALSRDEVKTMDAAELLKLIDKNKK